MNHPILLILAKVTLFSLMLAIGVNLSLEKLLSLWRKPGWLLRALLAVVVLVPLVVIFLLKLFHLPPEVATGLALLAAAPGAPLTTKRSQMAGVSIFQAAGLQLTLALIAVVATPLTLQIFNCLFALETERVTVLEVVRQVVMVQLIPVALGMALQRFWPSVSLKIGKPLNLIANSLFFGIGDCIAHSSFSPDAPTRHLVHFGNNSNGNYFFGYWIFLGGSNLERRAALAISCIARNIGLALFIAILSHVEEQVFPTLVAYAIVGAIIAIPYSRWSKRKLAEFPSET